MNYLQEKRLFNVKAVNDGACIKIIICLMLYISQYLGCKTCCHERLIIHTKE